MKLWILAHLPAGVRRRLIEGRIAGWLRQRGASEGMVMGLMDGYATKAAALGTMLGGVASAIHEAQAGNWPGVGQGVAAVGAGLALLGWRADLAGSVKLGAIGAAAGGAGLILSGVTHGFDFGEILKGWGLLATALTALGVYHSPGQTQARSMRLRGVLRDLAPAKRSAW